MINEQIRLRARASAMRPVVMRNLEDVIDGDALAMGGQGYATTLGDIHCAIVSAICADRHAKATGATLEAKVRTTVDAMLAAGDFDAIREGWRHILFAEDGMTKDHLAKVAGHHLRFSQGSNTIGGLIRFHWSITPSIIVADPYEVDDVPIPDRVVLERRAQLAAMHGVPPGEEERVRILVPEGDGWRDLAGGGGRPIPRLSHAHGECAFLVEGMETTIHADKGFEPRIASGGMSAAVLLHAPAHRFAEIAARAFASGRGREWAVAMSSRVVDVVGRRDKEVPGGAHSRVETWLTASGLEVVVERDVAETDLLRIVTRSFRISIDHEPRSFNLLDSILTERNQEIVDMTTELGRPVPKVDPVWLDHHTIDVPLVRALAAEGLDPKTALVSILEAGIDAVQAEERARRLGDEVGREVAPVHEDTEGARLIGRHGIEFAGGRIKARFDLGGDVRWDGGTLLIRRTSLPDVILGALAEQPVERMVDHPFLKGLTVKRVKVGLKGSRADIVRPARALAECMEV